MSRWSDGYKNHAFQETWIALKDELDKTTIDDVTVVTSVTELARLRKVIKYLDGLLNSLDPELLPLSTLDTFNAQLILCYQSSFTFNQTRNIAYLQAANTHADNLLTYIRPYMVVDGKAAKALFESTKQYSKTIDDYLSSFPTKSRELLNEIETVKKASGEIQAEIQASNDLVNEFTAKLFGSDEPTTGIESQVNAAYEDIEQKLAEIRGFHEETITDDDSTRNQLEVAKNLALTNEGKITQSLENVKSEVQDLNNFHAKIFGKQDDDGKQLSGLAAELDFRVVELTAFEKKQVTKYNALNAQIESLLPGATSAGLASAYREMKESFDKPIKMASYVYYFSIALLLIGFGVFTLQIGGEYWISFVKFDTWDGVLKGLASKLPFYGTLIWLATVASKRRSESQRLQQEYSHKEALAKSYDNYKKQLEALDGEDKAMQKEFITRAIDAIAYNASQTLDGKHGDAHPTVNMLDKISDTVKEIKSAVSK